MPHLVKKYHNTSTTRFQWKVLEFKSEPSLKLVLINSCIFTETVCYGRKSVAWERDWVKKLLKRGVNIESTHSNR